MNIKSFPCSLPPILSSIRMQIVLRAGHAGNTLLQIDAGFCLSSVNRRQQEFWNSWSEKWSIGYIPGLKVNTIWKICQSPYPLASLTRPTIPWIPRCRFTT